jgi:hypothetical protein
MSLHVIFVDILLPWYFKSMILRQLHSLFSHKYAQMRRKEISRIWKTQCFRNELLGDGERGGEGVAGGMKHGIIILAPAVPSSSWCVLESRQFVIELWTVNEFRSLLRNVCVKEVI